MRTYKLYYGEIAARISYQLFGLCETDLRLPKEEDQTLQDVICSISADAARVFDALEDLSGEHFIDWHKALDHFAKTLRSHISNNVVPTMADLILMAATSLNHCRAGQLSKLKKEL